MSPEKVLEMAAEYDQAVAYAMDDIERRAAAGDPECKETMRNKLSTEFVWQLLKEDIVERLGRMKDGADPMGQLSQKVSRKMEVPLEVAQQEIGRLVQMGLLQHQPIEGGHIWQWS